MTAMPARHVTVDVLLIPGTAEVFKGGVHLCLFGLAVMAAGYSAMAWGQRRERHLALNVGVYIALAWFEGQQLARHLNAGPP